MNAPLSPKTFTRSIPAAGEAPIPAASNENHAHGEAGRASQSGPSENHIGLDSSRLNPAGRSDCPTDDELSPDEIRYLKADHIWGEMGRGGL